MEKDFNGRVGKRIQNLRNKRGYTRENLAAMAQISSKFLYEIESGKKGCTGNNLLRISKALQVSCDYLLTGEHEKGNYSEDLLETIEMFDEEDTEKLIRLLNVVHEFVGER